MDIAAYEAARKTLPGPKRVFGIDPETGCIIPNSKPHPSGYLFVDYKGKRMAAARAIWLEQVGSIPDNLTIDHLCRNRQCMNLDHLELVTVTENIRRSPRVKLTAETVLEIRASDEPLRSLALRYGVCEATISMVRNKRIWLLEEAKQSKEKQ